MQKIIMEEHHWNLQPEMKNGMLMNSSRVKEENTEEED